MWTSSQTSEEIHNLVLVSTWDRNRDVLGTCVTLPFELKPPPPMHLRPRWAASWFNVHMPHRPSTFFFFVVNGWSVFLVTGLFLLSITKRTDFMANKTENAHELKGFSYKRGVGCWNRSLWLRNRNYFLCEWLEIGMRESLCGSLCHFVSRQCRNLYFLIKILLKFLN